MGPLQGGVDRVAILRRVKDADAAARFHRGGGHPIDREAMAQDMIGLGEGGVGGGLVADLMDETNIVWAIVPHQRRARLQGIDGRCHGGQRLVLDLDQFRRVHRLIEGFGNDESDAIAHIAHPIRDQARIGRTVKWRSVAALFTALGHWQIAIARSRPIGAGQHRQDAGRGFGTAGVDRGDIGMGMQRSQHHPMGHMRKRHIGDIAATAAQQTHILEPRYTLP